MDAYLKLLYEIPAAIAIGPLIVNLLPFGIDKKFNPLIMFLSALAVLLLPLIPVLALAMCIPMGYAYGALGVRLQGHEPVHLPIEEGRALFRRLRPKRDGPEEVLRQDYPDPDIAEIIPGIQKFVPEL